MVNRDESVLREQATPPAWRKLLRGDGKVMQAMWPTDPTGGGTWLGANERGLLLTLLNYNLESSPGVPMQMRKRADGTNLRSRGEIIPQLLAHERCEEAAAALARSELEHYGPFRLIAVDGGEAARVLEMRWDMQRLDVREFVTPPVCFASSGLGDSLVRVRADLFAKMLGEADAVAAQRAFHEHQWPHATHISVMMSRKGVQTVSVSAVEVRGGAVEFVYRDVPQAGRE